MKTCAHYLPFAVCILLCSGAIAAEPVKLRYKFTKDQVIHYTVNQKDTRTTIKQQAESVIKTTARQEKHLRVVAVDSQGNATLESVIDRAKMSAQWDDGKPTEFDSDHPEDAPRSYLRFAKVIGRPLGRIRVTPRGDLVSSRAMLAPALQSQVSNGIGGKATASSTNYLVVFPEDAIEVGDTWKEKMTTQVKIPSNPRLTRTILMERRFQLDSVKDGVATIQVRTHIVTPALDPEMQYQLMERTPRGEIKFDIERGLITSQSLKLDSQVIGALGPGSSARAVTNRTEELVTKQEKPSDAPTASE